MPESDRSVVVLALDGLSARMLGPYANTWFSTFQFDRLAAQSMLLEFAFTDCPDLLHSYQSLWGERNGFGGLALSQSKNDLIQKLANAGVESTLFTDELLLAESSIATQFDRVMMHPIERSECSASDPSETMLAEFFSVAIERAVLTKPGELLWIHSTGLNGSWDAPYEMRQQFADEEDPDPPTFVQPPSHFYASDELEPDERLGFQQACAAQVVLIDQFIGILLEHLEAMPRSKQPLLIVTSPRGFPLGTGGHVGQADQSLFDDSIHVPVLARWPDGRHATSRHQSLRYLRCVSDLVLEWLQAADVDLGWLDNPLPNRENEYLLSVTQGKTSLRTHGWKLLENGDEQQLFVKPDDRWDTNDVLRKCRLIGEELSELRAALVDEIRSQGAYQPRALADQLAQHPA